ncbi:MAG: CPBP family intramembrane metalloprotease [Cyanobacteria bacterium SZAS TMP-1]|nr:CPBP family intramembrane metalloprotease [Cyanobacteria bacterium SZAS TMP-1]
MNTNSPDRTGPEGGFGFFRRPTIATLAIGMLGALGFALAFIAVYALRGTNAVQPYLPSITEALFSLGTTALPLAVAYCYFTNRADFLTGWSQKLHPFFHLTSQLPGFPGALGYNYRSSGMTGKKVFLWALGGLLTVYLLSLCSAIVLFDISPDGALTEALPGPSVAQSGTQALTAVSRLNFAISALGVGLLAAIMEELIFRGILLNLWRQAFSAQADWLGQRSGWWARNTAKFLSVGGAYLAVMITAFLFAVPRSEGWDASFIFGLVAGILYVQTRTIWTPIVMHVLSSLVLAAVVFAGTYHLGASNQVMVPPIAPVTASTVNINKPTAAVPALTTSGVRLPAHRGVIGAASVKKSGPLVVSITQEGLDREDFAAGGNTMIQVCKPDECPSQLTVMESLAKQYPDVEFVQADRSKNDKLVARLEAEQASMAASAGGNSEVAYPVYVYVNGSMQIAPPATTSETDLKKFIDLNFGAAEDDDDEMMAPYISKACNADNQGPFDGKVLYACVFDTVVKTDLSLLEPAKRQAFIAKWEHKFDGGQILATEESSAKAIKEMLADLNEMHTHFFTAKEFSSLAQDFDASLTGIGAPITRLNVWSKAKALGVNASTQDRAALSRISEDTPIIVFPAPDEGSPAAQAGMAAGDRIVEVDGKPSVGRTVDEVVKDIKGKGVAGSTVEIKVMRPAGDNFEIRNFKLTRQAIHTKEIAVKALDNGFARMTVKMFGNSVSKEFTDSLYTACTGKTLPAGGQALAEAVTGYTPERDCGLKGLIIDLRGNPGGRLDQVMEMLQAVVKQGVLVSTMTREGDQIVEVKESVTADAFIREKIVDGKTIQTVTHPRFWRVLPAGLPLVIVVDGNSASASELMSASLQFNRLATVVGVPSFGKEVGQSVNPLDFGTGVKITTFRFLPGGAYLGVAVLPDFEATQGSAYLDDPINGPDLMMLKAQEVLAQGKAAVEAARSPETKARKAAMAEQTKQMHRERDSAYLAAQKAGLEE